MKILSLLLLTLLVSCASAKKTAMKLTEKGDCEGALDFWALAYKSDPKDEEVQDGFRHCQEKVSNDRLVKIRDLRNARKEEEALNELLSLIALQSKHGMRLDYNSSTFQGKESQHLWRHSRLQVQNLIKESQPLAADYRQRRYSMVFNSFPEFGALNLEVKSAGAVHCKTIQKGIKTRPFLRSFVEQYCHYFSPDRSPGAAPDEVAMSDVLYQSPLIEGTLSGPGAVFNERLKVSLQEGFEKSPWYHPQGKRPAKMGYSGSFTTSVFSEWTKETHSYQVSIPYTVYKKVKRTRQIPYVIGGMTRYRTEDYEDSVPETKYRNETRTHKYMAQRKRQDLAFAVAGNLSVENSSHPYSVTISETENRILHNEDIPDIGLYPARRDISSPSDKFEEYRMKAMTDMTNQFNQLWVKKFCALTEDRSFQSTGEAVIKCRRSPAHPKDFVDQWFVQNFAVSAADVETIIGKF